MTISEKKHNLSLFLDRILVPVIFFTEQSKQGDAATKGLLSLSLLHFYRHTKPGNIIFLLYGLL